MRKKFNCYAIQLGKSKEVLYVNYSSEVDKSFQKFLQRHTRLQSSKLRLDLTENYQGYTNSRRAARAARQLIEKLETAGYQVIAGGPLLLPHYQTYVLELNGDPRHVYVGETNYPREKRFQQHIYFFNSARELKHIDVFRLYQELCDSQKYASKDASLRAEAQLAKKLREEGYRVEGGH